MSTLKTLFDRRPYLFALLLTLVWVLVPWPFAALLPKLAPGLPETLQRLAALLAMSALTFGLVRALELKRRIGLGRLAPRQLPLLVLPGLVLLWPLLYGVRPVGLGDVTILLLGYALTGVMEEVLVRGVIFQSLLARGALRAVFISALLFGAAHVGRLLFGSPLPLVLFQVMFAVFDGVLYGALRLRLGNLWPLIALHAAGDFALALGQVPQPLWSYLYLGGELLVLAYGLALLLPYRLRRARPALEPLAR